MRVAVFIDWMNAYRQARAAFDLEAASNPRGQFNPLALARILAGANKRRETAELVRVEIHRGLPHPTTTVSAMPPQHCTDRHGKRSTRSWFPGSGPSATR